MDADLRLRGGDDGIRTHDPHVANVMLSQLSYIPTYERVNAQESILQVRWAFVNSALRQPPNHDKTSWFLP